jgi:transcriptional regulator with XRE-family HTH domain
MSVASVIKQRLSELDMTQTELAEKIGTTRQNLANKMTRDNFSSKELCSIGEALDLKLVLKDTKGNEYTIKY